MEVIMNVVQEYYHSLSNPNIITATAAALIAVGLSLGLWVRAKSRCVYLVDFACYRPPDCLRVPESHFLEHSEISDVFNEESNEFQEKILLRSGIGGEAGMPAAAHEIPPEISLAASRAEVEEVLGAAASELMAKTHTDPRTIDIVVSNCSLFCPTPSIAAAVAARLRLREDVRSFSLSGMGCSAGLLAVSLAKDLLGVRSDATALVLSMESVTANGYKGKVKSMLIANVLFRMGGAAILLSNRRCDAATAKYELRHLVRTHVGADDNAYSSVIQDVDPEGMVGVSISRSLLGVASKALKINVSELGPLVLPYYEQLRYAASATWRSLTRPFSVGSGDPVYVPNFKRAFEHFCIHAGGRAVIDGLEEKLRLNRQDTEASRMTLYRFGNTSSSSVWYELCYLEAKGKVKNGDRVWQIAFGSGFKCNSAVWRRINYDCNHHHDHGNSEINAWSDRIDRYPVDT